MATLGVAIIGGIVAGGVAYLLTPSINTNQEGARLTSSRLTTSTEGAGIVQLFGRQRLGGQIIWATEFKETVTTQTQSSGGKGGSKQTTTTTTYSYSISFAMAFCEANGKASMSRLWADGKEIDISTLDVTFYDGSETQVPDPFIESIQGAGKVPAYRGIAYAVFENLELAEYGNRVPQFTAEIVVPLDTDDPDDIQNAGEAFCLIPASGETIYQAEAVQLVTGQNSTKPDNVHNAFRQPDMVYSMDNLIRMQDNLDAVLLVVSWFGNDLRAGTCQIRPRTESQNNRTLTPVDWTVAGYTRATAEVVPYDDDGRPEYGGTPSDASISSCIAHLKSKGLRVVFYPFILMVQEDGNTLPNPYSDNESGVGQPVKPWRGRITCSPADGFAGSPNNTAAAATQINAFFDEYDAMVEHYADLCAAAGGVDGFIVGTELPGITKVRSATGVYPAVSRLQSLAAYAKTAMPTTKVGYAADWSEWVDDASDGYWFHLDPLWADANVDFCGVDNYLPMSDWRDGTQHLDYDAVNGPTSEYDLDYLASQIEGGEYWDYFYADVAARNTQTRTTITDGTYQTPWVYRRKAFRDWWLKAHHNRPNHLEDDLGNNTHDPTLYTSISGATLTASAEPAYGPFGAAIDVASAGGNADRARTHSNALDGTVGKRYVCRVWAKHGSSDRFRLVLAHSGGNAQLRYVYSTDVLTSVPSVHTINAFERYDLGGGIDLFEVDITLGATDASIFLEAGPYTLTAGEHVILLGASIQEYGVSTTAWVPGSKPIWFTEFGVPAVDKGTNQPNVFFDPSSSESALPYFSSGSRDDFIQRLGVEVTYKYWRDNAPDNGSGLTMVEPENMFVWTWDARPFPDYPVREGVWSDGSLWFKGHWWTGRIESIPLARLVAHLCRRAGLSDDQYDVSGLYGPGALVRGYRIDEPEPLRDSLGALMDAYQFDAFESEGKIKFVLRINTKLTTIDGTKYVVSAQDPVGVEVTRSQETELPQKVTVEYIDEFNDFNEASVDGKTSRGYSQNVDKVKVPINLTTDYAQGLADSKVQQAWIERQRGKMVLPPSMARFDPGDAASFPVGNNTMTARLTSVSIGESMDIEFFAFDPQMSRLPVVGEEERLPRLVGLFGQVALHIMDLPLFTGEEPSPHAPRLAATANPWPGGVNVYKKNSDDTYTFNTQHPFRNAIGELSAPLSRGVTGSFDRTNTLSVTLENGSLQSTTEALVLESALALGVYNAAKDEWEIIQFATAALQPDGSYNVTDMLRGQLGTEHAMGEPEVPTGSLVVVLEPSLLSYINVSFDVAGNELTYRYGPSRYDVSDDTYKEETFTGKRVGLRPYAPSGLVMKALVAGDLNLSWKRRTRFDGDSWEIDEVPLNETDERYRLQIYDGANVVRTVETTAPEYSYALADQIADFGSAQTQLTIDVAQYGGNFGGYGITATATLNISKVTP